MLEKRSLVVVLALAYPATAQADRQSQCIEDFERAQRTRKAGRLLDSRREFRLCADETCPSMLRKDCTDALAQLGTAIPSVRPKLLDAAGAELTGYELEIDGARVAVGSEPIELDPGEHVLAFSKDGQRVEERVTLRTGDLAVPVTARSSPRPSPKPKPEPRAGSTPTLAWVLGGVAVVGGAGFVGFGLAGRSTERCKGRCSDDEIDTLHRQYLLADVSLGVALVSGGIAGWLFLSSNNEPESGWVGVAPTRAGALVGGGRRF